VKVVSRQWSVVSKRLFYFALSASLIALSFPVEAQEPKKVPGIGFLTAASASSQALRLEALRRGLKDFGYFEGKNITIDYRFADGKLDRAPSLAAELVRLKVNIIVTGGGTSTRAAKEATLTIPIVMGFDNDPVGNGFVASLARPGGNVTGLSTLSPEISGKQLELLKEVVPKLSRVGVLGSSIAPGNPQALKEIELAAGAFGVKLQYLEVRDPDDFETAFRAASKARADAVLVLPSPITLSQRKQIADLAAKSRLPATYWATEFVDVGGLMSYSVSFTDLFQRAATYVDKILRGTKPADRPACRASDKFELVINLKAAKQIGLTIPPNVLVRADKVIR
jgi:putative ABC transport system substrate-binding protein